MTIDNRLTRPDQILAYLATVGQPRGNSIGHLPRTGDIIAALGLPRTRASYASVSRSLARLCKAGKVDCYSGEIYIPGKGGRYCLASAAEPE
jgi:hypothetical protein